MSTLCQVTCFNKTGNVRINVTFSRVLSNHFYNRKAVTTTHSECVSVALGIQHSKRMLRILSSSVACPTLPQFSTLSDERHGFRGENKITAHKMSFFFFNFPYDFCPKQFSCPFPSFLSSVRRLPRLPIQTMKEFQETWYQCRVTLLYNSRWVQIFSLMRHVYSSCEVHPDYLIETGNSFPRGHVTGTFSCTSTNTARIHVCC